MSRRGRLNPSYVEKSPHETKRVLLENAAVNFGGLSCIEKTSLRCISTYRYLTKRPRTHREMVFPSSWYTCNKSSPQLKNAEVNFGGLLRINKTALKCISIYSDHMKQHGTH